MPRLHKVCKQLTPWCEIPAVPWQVRVSTDGGSLPACFFLLWTSTPPLEHCTSPSCFLCSLSALLIIHHPFLCKTTRPMLQNPCTPPILLLSWQRTKWTRGDEAITWQRSWRGRQTVPTLCRGAELWRHKVAPQKSASPNFLLVSVTDFKTNWAETTVLSKIWSCFRRQVVQEDTKQENTNNLFVKACFFKILFKLLNYCLDIYFP